MIKYCNITLKAAVAMRGRSKLDHKRRHRRSYTVTKLNDGHVIPGTCACGAAPPSFGGHRGRSDDEWCSQEQNSVAAWSRHFDRRIAVTQPRARSQPRWIHNGPENDPRGSSWPVTFRLGMRSLTFGHAPAALALRPPHPSKNYTAMRCDG